MTNTVLNTFKALRTPEEILLNLHFNLVCHTSSRPTESYPVLLASQNMQFRIQAWKHQVR